MKRIYTLLTLVVLCLHVSAQSDPFCGHWVFEMKQGNSASVKMSLKIGTAEKNLLYPAELSIAHDSFQGVYQLLLVKRNARQLSIGRNKVPSHESPFSIGNLAFYLNGFFDFSRDRSVATLSIERMVAKQYGFAIKDLGQFPQREQPTAKALLSLFKDQEIKLKKLGSESFNELYSDSILVPGISGAYFGIMDSIIVPEKSGTLNFSCNRKANGVVSVSLNGNPVIDQNHLSERKPEEDLRLDTGLNFLVLHADEYGKTPGATGCMQLKFGEKTFTMDFSNAKDIGAGFIVAKIYYAPEKEAEKQNNGTTALGILRELSDKGLQADIKRFHYPHPEAGNLVTGDSARKEAEKALQRDAKPVGNIKANTREIILALWDDAVEDGDSISLNINGHWVVQRFPVKKKPQFISVKLDPGANRIVFIADNLGAIVPNTAILEIIDGRQRRAFMIDTDLGRNNLINILYTFSPE